MGNGYRRWRPLKKIKHDKRLTDNDRVLLDWMREDAARLREQMAPLLDRSTDAARHARADEITDGKFSREMEKYK